MNENIAYAVFDDCNTAVTNALWQFDYGQVLKISGIELPQNFEVHFCNKGDVQTVTQLGADGEVTIPDQFLVNPEWVEAYIFLHSTADDGETMYKISIPVRERPEPSDVEPTPQEQSVITQTIAALDAAVAEAESIAEGIPTAIDTALAEAKASGEFDGPAGAPGTNIWWIGELNPVRSVVVTNLNGNPNATPALYDFVFAPQPGVTGDPDTLYYIATLNSSNHRARLDKICSIKGDDGVSPEVTITEISGGHRITITDADHPDGQSFDVMDGTGGGGTSDYSNLTNKPQIEGVTLSGNKTASDLGLAKSSDIPTVPSAYTSTPADLGTASAGSSTSWAKGDHVHKMPSAADVGAYALPSGGIPATDLAEAVQTSLGKADTALQSAPVTSVNGQTGAVSLSIPSTAADVGAVAVAQGVAHAGEFVVVGSDGNITTVTMSVWQGGSY